jgi:hypothetical protein
MYELLLVAAMPVLCSVVLVSLIRMELEAE